MRQPERAPYVTLSTMRGGRHYRDLLADLLMGVASRPHTWDELAELGFGPVVEVGWLTPGQALYAGEVLYVPLGWTSREWFTVQRWMDALTEERQLLFLPGPAVKASGQTP